MQNNNKNYPENQNDNVSDTMKVVTGQHYTEQHPLVLASLLEILYQRVFSNQLIFIIGALLSIIIFYNHTAVQYLLIWAGIIITIASIQIYLARRFLQNVVNTTRLNRNYTVFNCCTAAIGLAWGACILLPPGDETYLVSLCMIILFAVGGSAVISLSAALKSFIIFILFCYGPSAIWLITTRPYEQQMMAVLLVVYSGFLLSIAKNQHQTFLKNVFLKLHNESLVKHLRKDEVIEQNIRNQLEENEDRLRDLFDNASDLIFVIYVDGTFAYVNKKWKDILGYNEDEVKKLHYRDIVHPAQMDEAKKNIHIVYSGKALTIESVLIDKSGRQIDIIGTVNCILKNGRPYQIRCMYRDVTDQKKTSSMLQNAQQKYQNIVNNALDMIFTTDIQGNFTFANKVSSEITEYDMNELIGMNCLELIKPEYRHLAGDFFAGQLKNNIRENSYLFPIKTKSGNTKWLHQNTQMLFENQQLVGFQAVARDVTEQIKIEAELRRAKEYAEESRKAEETFIASISHEIRTPMNAVVGLIDLMSKTKLDATQEEYLQSLSHSSGRLLKIVNDLLEFKRIQAGKIEFIKAPFSLKDVLKQQISIFSNQANLRGIDFSYEIDELVPDSLVGDEARLSQILQNLISNAIKYTENGYVKIIVTNDSPHQQPVKLKFSIIDTGAGIPENKLANIFDAYQQVDIRRDFSKGSGMGLAIFKSLVELQGGNIYVESSPGSGSIFTFWLEFSTNQENSINEAKTDTSKLLYDLEPFSILVVDDDAMNIYVVLKFLEEFNNIKITTAEDGKKALSAFNQNDYDIIMTDINMPVMDGYEMTRHIRNEFESPKSEVPIIALTAELTPHEELRAAGIDDYLMKPFTREALYKKIYEFFIAKQHH